MEIQEEIQNLRGEKVTRIKTSVILGAGFFSLMLGILLFYVAYKHDVRYMMTVGGLLIFFVFPVTLVYPVVRFLIGGRDSVLGLVASVAIEEYLKGKVKNHLERDRK